MELSPKVDIDLSESSLSFISGLSCKDDDSVLLPDALNTEAFSHIDAGDILKSVDPSHDLFSINFDKNTTLTSEDGSTSLSSITTLESASIPDFPSINESLQSSSMNFITQSQAPKNIETIAVKSNVSSIAKHGQAQVLILQKPQNILLNPKNLPIASSTSNVAIVQTSTGMVPGAKILTLPAFNASGNVLTAVNQSISNKSSDVKILLGQVPASTPTFVTTKQMVPPGASGSNVLIQAPLKRSVASSSAGQMITKVILTNNSSSNQTMATPVPVSASNTGLNASQTPILLASPNKSLTISRNLLNASNAPQVLKVVSSTPTKQYVLSPVKPSQKVTYAPVTYSKSPRRIAPATISNLNSGSKLTTVVCPTTTGPTGLRMSVGQSPTKVILKPVSQTGLVKPFTSVNNANTIATTFATIAPSNASSIQPTSSGAVPVQVSGSKFHYVRLVSAPTSVSSTAAKKETGTLMPLCAATAIATNTVTVTTSTVSNISQIRPTVPIAPAKMITPKPSVPKLIIPAVSGSQLRNTTSVTTSQLGQLPGTLIPVGGGNTSSYVMVPAQYVTQLQQQTSSSATIGTPVVNILPAPTPPSSGAAQANQSSFISIASNAPSNNFHTTNAPAHHSPRRTPILLDNDNRPRKPCNCTKSQCLKLYCDCFANGEFCNSCNCNNCYNNLTHEEERQKAIKACLDRNPLAFHPKIGKTKDGDKERRHTKGCNCKRSYCLKNYCECYEAKILCTNLCKCIGCKNFEDSNERKTLMHLADAAEVRVQQQAVASTNLSSQILDFPTKPPVISRTGERLPFAFVTDEVLEATCLCLLAHANDAELSHTSEEETEKLVLQEFSRCLVRIIDCANKTKVAKMDT